MCPRSGAVVICHGVSPPSLRHDSLACDTTWHMPVAKTSGKAGGTCYAALQNPHLGVGSVRPSPQQGGGVVATTNSTVRQRELGKRLRELRNGHGYTVEEVAERLLCSATKISRLETGTRRPSLRDVRDLCALYEVDEPKAAEFMELARGAREQVWWTQYEDLKLDPYLGLEQVANAITSYTMYYIPALLQIEEYTKV